MKGPLRHPSRVCSFRLARACCVFRPVSCVVIHRGFFVCLVCLCQCFLLACSAALVVLATCSVSRIVVFSSVSLRLGSRVRWRAAGFLLLSFSRQWLRLDSWLPSPFLFLVPCSLFLAPSFDSVDAWLSAVTLRSAPGRTWLLTVRCKHKDAAVSLSLFAPASSPRSSLTAMHSSCLVAVTSGSWLCLFSLQLAFCLLKFSSRADFDGF